MKPWGCFFFITIPESPGSIGKSDSQSVKEYKVFELSENSMDANSYPKASGRTSLMQISTSLCVLQHIICFIVSISSSNRLVFNPIICSCRILSVASIKQLNNNLKCYYCDFISSDLSCCSFKNCGLIWMLPLICIEGFVGLIRSICTNPINVFLLFLNLMIGKMRQLFFTVTLYLQLSRSVMLGKNFRN